MLHFRVKLGNLASDIHRGTHKKKRERERRSDQIALNVLFVGSKPNKKEERERNTRSKQYSARRPKSHAPDRT